MQLAEEKGFMSPREPDEKIWAWDEVPELAAAFEEGRVDSYFPLYQVNAI
jgi:hypothetical protein